MEHTGPIRMDQEEDRRVDRLRRMALQRPHLTQSTEKLNKRWMRKKVISISPVKSVLGFSNAISAGDALMKKLKYIEYAKAQNGPVRVFVKKGKKVFNTPALG